MASARVQTRRSDTDSSVTLRNRTVPLGELSTSMSWSTSLIALARTNAPYIGSSFVAAYALRSAAISGVVAGDSSAAAG
jgi:hypothetical protein